ncbi:MAG: hypothetical protein Q9157_007963 [Trypethelium eluteriae]
MASPIVLLSAGLVLAYLINVYRCFARNLAAAKQSGIPYVSAPLYPLHWFWLATAELWLPFLGLVPGSSKWIKYGYPSVSAVRDDHLANVHSFLRPGMAWSERYETFKRLESDIYLLVTPSRISLSVADAEVINQIVARRNDFPKPTYMYRSIDIYGKNVITTEGSIWRQHRKITAPPFSETNNRLVWTESLHQAQAMMTSWVGEDGNGERTIHTVDADAMRLSLHVISRAAFGRRVKWPHEERTGSNAEKDGETDRSEVPPGHTMPYKEALQSLLEHIIWLVILPRWFLKSSPFKVHKRAYAARTEWGKYMNEIYTEKRAEVVNGETTSDRIDLMGALVRGAGFTEGDPVKNGGAEADAEKG